MWILIRIWLVLPWLFFFSSPPSVPSLLAEVVKPEALYDKSRALIIGIEQYMQASSVPGAVDEGKQIAEVFRQLGFEEIIELYNKDATSRRLHQALTDIFARKVDRKGRVVVFFAGHTGITRNIKGGDLSYLVPADAYVNKAAKSLTVETFRELTRRSPSKHILLIIDATVRAWEAALRPMSPQAETDTEAPAVQVIARADQREKPDKAGGKTPFVGALLTGLSGAADLNQNGWLTASELGTYLKQQVDAISLRLDGDGDTVLLQQRTGVPVVEPSSQTAKDREAAKSEYDHAVALLQGGKYAEEALARLNRAIEYDPTFGDAYLLKSYLRLEVLPQLNEALAAGQQAVKALPDNPEAFYTLGLAHEKMGHYNEAEEAFIQAVKLNPENESVYFLLGTLYEDQLNDKAKSVAAFRRYLQLGGANARARSAVSLADQAVVSPPDSSP
jgi:tetratricopeptide (TPR) repeat protein